MWLRGVLRILCMKGERLGHSTLLFHCPLNCISSQPSRKVDGTEKDLVTADFSATYSEHPRTRSTRWQLQFMNTFIRKIGQDI